MKFRYGLLLLIIFSAFLCFFRLGSHSLHNGDEAKYAFVALEMLQSGEWLTPHIEGEVYFGKPPLRFWLTALLYRFFGTSEWVIRSWSALAAVATVAFTALLGKILFGHREGILGGFALATSVQYLYEHSARSGEMEALVLFFWVSSLYFLVRAEEKPRYLYISAVLIGLGSLAKNFAGMFPLGLAILYLIVTGKWRNFKIRSLVFFLLLSLGVSFLWVGAMAYIHRENFVEQFIVKESLRRISSDEFKVGIKEARSFSGGITFTTETILNGFFPWSLVLLPAIVAALWESRKWLTQSRILVVLWCVGYLAGFLFFKNKRYWYIMPVYPAAALLVAWFVSEAFSEGHRIKLLILGLIVIPGAVLLSQDGLYDPSSGRAIDVAVNTLRFSAGAAQWILIAAAIVLFLLLWRSRFWKAAAFMAKGVLVIAAAIFSLLPLRYADHKADIHILADTIEEHATGARNAVFLWHIPRQVFYPSHPLWAPGGVARWYMRSIPRTRLGFLGEREDNLTDLLSEGGNKLFLMPQEFYLQIRSKYPHRFVAARSVHQRIYVLIAPQKG